MKFNQYFKPFLLLFAIFLWGGSDVGALNNTNAPPSELAQPQPLTELLKQVSEKYQVIFSYESKLLNEINVDFTFREEETIDGAIDRLLSQTGLRYQIIGKKYFIIHQDSKESNRNARKIKKKLKQIQKLERRGKLSLNTVQSKASSKLNNVIHSVVKLKAEKTISGTVTDEKGEALIGATIQAKGTTLGTIADVEGAFQLSVPDDVTILVVSYLGYITQEVNLQGSTTFQIVLEEDAAKLEEVVVVGYGKLSRENITNAVSTVTSEDIDAFPASSVEQSLAGKLPGVQLSQSSGQPGAGISIRIRGLASISGGNEPLFVVDGTPFFSSDTRGLNGISSINPNDIESIQVLKDASSTAIYGSRGANGVVLITTKSGKVGAKPTISYNSWVSARTVRNTLDLMSGSEFLGFQNRFFANSGLTVPDEITSIQNANTDWQDEVFQTGISSNHDLSLSGGNEKSQYYISVNRLREEGVVLNSDFERISFRTNLSSKLNETFSIKTSLTASNSIQNGFNAAENNNTLSFITSGIGSTLLALPVVPVLDAEGNFNNVFPFSFASQIENPVQYAEELLDKTTVNRFLGSFSIDTKIAKGLKNVTRFGVDYQNLRNDGFLPSTFSLSAGGSASLLTNTTLNWVVEDYVEYRKDISSDLNLTAIAGFSLQEETNESVFLQSFGFFSDDLQNNAIQAGSTIAVPITNNVEQNIASAFGRINLNYKDKYLFESSLRTDGASVFSENNKTATFPSISAGWKLSKEDFLSGVSDISNLKVRASWGQSGNPGIQPFQSLPLGQIVTTSQGAGTSLATGIAPNLPNRNLTWETTTQTNVGLDLGLFSNRFTLSFDYYRKNTEDALTSIQLPPSGGFATIIDNVGEIENKGFELSIGGILIDKKDLSFSVDFNISRNENEITALNNDNDLISEFSFAQTADAVGGVANVARVGEQLGAFLGYDFTGVDENGEPTYRDVDGSGSLDEGDRIVIGNPIPEILYGFNTNLSYKNFQFTTNWQGVTNVDILNLGLFNLTSPDNSVNRLNSIEEFYPNVNQNTEHRVSQRYVESGAFLRMKNIRIGYHFPIKNALLESVGLFISGQNLITITDYTGFDPDVNSLSGNSINQGVDLAAFPAAKSYTFGLNVKF